MSSTVMKECLTIAGCVYQAGCKTPKRKLLNGLNGMRWWIEVRLVSIKAEFVIYLFFQFSIFSFYLSLKVSL